MKLFFIKGACSLAPNIVLNELGLPHIIEEVNPRDKTCLTGDFTMINPKGSVPALKMENGEILTEGAIISQYLADLKGDGQLLGKFGTLERLRTLEWMNFIATEVHKSFTPVFQAGRISSTAATQTDVKNHYKNVLTDKCTFIAKKLGTNDYLMGKDFTIADAYLFTCLSWSKHVGFDLTPFPIIVSYLARVGERPAVLKAMKAEGLL